MIRILTLFTLIIPIWLALGGESRACSCSRTLLSKSATQLVRDTPILFWGRAVSIEDYNSGRRVGRYSVYKVEIWAANAAMPQTVRVRTPSEGALCGVKLPLNQPVLIGGDAKDGYINTSYCLHVMIQRHQAEITKTLRTCRAFAGCPDK